jgi:hypothetical protein
MNISCAKLKELLINGLATNITIYKVENNYNNIAQIGKINVEYLSFIHQNKN